MLLLKINQRWPIETQRRYDELTTKRQAETLTAEEQQELLGLIDQSEQVDAERAQMIGDLAQSRRVPVPELMQDLGIRTLCLDEAYRQPGVPRLRHCD